VGFDIFILRILPHPWRMAHPLMGYVGFSVSHFKWCSMHCLNLGILQYVNGSATELLCTSGFLGLHKGLFFHIHLCFGNMRNISVYYVAMPDIKTCCIAEDSLALPLWIINCESALRGFASMPVHIALSHLTRMIYQFFETKL